MGDGPWLHPPPENSNELCNGYVNQGGDLCGEEKVNSDGEVQEEKSVSLQNGSTEHGKMNGEDAEDKGEGYIMFVFGRNSKGSAIRASLLGIIPITKLLRTLKVVTLF